MQIINNSEAMTSDNKPKEPAVLLQRIGSTVYSINVHFADNNAERLEDKFLRLIEQEVSKIA